MADEISLNRKIGEFFGITGDVVPVQLAAALGIDLRERTASDKDLTGTGPFANSIYT